MMNANGADGAVATQSQKSAQQHLRRLQDNKFLDDFFYTDAKLTPTELDRGRRLHLARLQKNTQQREHICHAAEANGADGAAAAWSQKSAQQRLRRLQNNNFLHDLNYTGFKLTPTELVRGRQLHFARLRKNIQQRKQNHRAAEDRAAEEKRESENTVCLAATPAAFAPLLSELADEEKTLISVKLKAKALCCFEGCDNQIRAGGVCSRHGAKQTRRTCSMEGCTNQA